LRDVVARHGALRTTVNPYGKSQVIRADWEPEISTYDYTAAPPARARRGGREDGRTGKHAVPRTS